MTRCESCGREAQGQKYCSNCVKEDGSLKEFDQVAQLLADELVGSQGLHSKAALEVAKSILPKHPAWEHVGKKQEKKRQVWKYILIGGIIVSLAVTSIVAFRLGKKESEEAMTEHNLPKVAVSPFEDIEEKLIDDETLVYEMRCPGDQKLNSLDGQFLMFRSLEGSEYSQKWKMYNFDITNLAGYPFEPSSIETRTMLANMESPLVFHKNTGAGTVNWLYIPKEGKITGLPMGGLRDFRFGDYYVYYKRHGKPFTDDYKGMSIVAINLKTQDQFTIEPQGTSFILIGGGKRYIYFQDFASEKIKKYDLVERKSYQVDIEGGGIWAREEANDRYIVFIDIEFEEDGEVSKYKTSVLDTVLNKTVILSEKTSDAIKLTNPKNLEETIIGWTENADDEKTSIKYVSARNFNEVKTLEIPEGKSAVLEGITQNCIIWSHGKGPLKGRYQDLNGIKNTPTGSDLWVYNFKENKHYMLESEKRQGLLYSDNFIAWEKYQGSKNDQFYNICVAEIPPQKVENWEAESEGESPVENIVEHKQDGFSVYELACKGDQEIKRVEGPIMTIMSLEKKDPWIEKRYIFNLEKRKGALLEEEAPSNEALRVLDDMPWSYIWSKSSSESSYYYSYSPKSGKVSDLGKGEWASGSNVSVLKGNVFWNPKDKTIKKTMIFDPLTGKSEAFTEMQRVSLSFVDSFGDNNPNIIFNLASGKGKDYKNEIWSFNTVTKKKSKIFDNVGNSWGSSAGSTYLTLEPDMHMGDFFVIDLRDGKQFRCEKNYTKKPQNYNGRVISKGTTPEETYIAWPYPVEKNGKTLHTIAYANIPTLEKKGELSFLVLPDKLKESVGMIDFCGDNLLYSYGDISHSREDNTKVFAFNLKTQKTFEVGMVNRNSLKMSGNTIYWTRQIGRRNKQGTNIFFATLP